MSKKNRKQFTFIMWLILFIIYLGTVLYVTLFAWNYGSSFGPVGPGGRNYNMEPFLSIYNISMYSNSLVNPLRILGGNILLFVPFGFLFALLLRAKSTISSILLFIYVIFSGFLLSTMIETAQFLFTYRVANIDDVILNSTGTVIGFLLYVIFTSLLKRR